MKRHFSATEILLNIIRGGIIIAIAVTIICYFTDNSATSTIVLNGAPSASSDSESKAGAVAFNSVTSKTDSAPQASSTTGNSADTALININTATAEQLTALNGIGEKKAAAIVEYRREHGSFATVDELKNVSGIGEKTLNNIRNQITV